MPTADPICNVICSIDAIEFCRTLECSVCGAHGLIWIVPLSVALYRLFVVIALAAMFLASGFVFIFKVSQITLSKEQVMLTPRRNLFLLVIIFFYADVM